MFITICIHAHGHSHDHRHPPHDYPDHRAAGDAGPAMQGRLFSLISVAVFGFTALSMALTGILSELVPISIIYAVVGVMAAGVGAVGWLIKDFREME